MTMGRLRFTEQIVATLSQSLKEMCADRLFILTDTNTFTHCLPKVVDIPALSQACVFCVSPDDEHKNVASLARVWDFLSRNDATRHSCLINIGGGMVTDLGGFAAATFKRGMRFINVPTTLLAMVDASVGGKTGVNFNGLKNEIGVFAMPHAVLMDACFFQTLDRDNLLSGFAEMIKHALLDNQAHRKALCQVASEDMEGEKLSALLCRSVLVKADIVAKDPHESGLRKALNLGHTFGHAFESFAMYDRHKPILHGFAVAYGLVCELYMSVLKCGFPLQTLRQVAYIIRESYGRMSFSCKDYERLIALMRHDKKNKGDRISVTLLSDIGGVELDQFITEEEIKEVLDFYLDGI